MVSEDKPDEVSNGELKYPSKVDLLKRLTETHASQRIVDTAMLISALDKLVESVGPRDKRVEQLKLLRTKLLDSTFEEVNCALGKINTGIVKELKESEGTSESGNPKIWGEKTSLSEVMKFFDKARLEGHVFTEGEIESIKSGLGNLPLTDPMQRGVVEGIRKFFDGDPWERNGYDKSKCKETKTPHSTHMLCCPKCKTQLVDPGFKHIFAPKYANSDTNMWKPLY